MRKSFFLNQSIVSRKIKKRCLHQNLNWSESHQNFKMALFSIRARKIHESTFMCEGGEWVRCTVHGSIEKERKRRKKWRKSFNKMLQAAPYAQQKKVRLLTAHVENFHFLFSLSLPFCLLSHSLTHSLVLYVISNLQKHIFIADTENLCSYLFVMW